LKDATILILAKSNEISFVMALKANQSIQHKDNLNYLYTIILCKNPPTHQSNTSIMFTFWHLDVLQ